MAMSAKVNEQIRFRMEELGISVTELARRLGISHQTVRWWISGRNYPNKDKALAIERELGFKLDFSEGANTQLPGAVP